jgi:hypothetical protein
MSTVHEEDPTKARRRVEEEMARIQRETAEKRAQKMKELVGEQASPTRQRRENVKLSQELYTKKGTNPEEKKKPDLEEIMPVITTENTLQARKQAYATKLEEFSHKGKEHIRGEDAIITPPLSQSPIKQYKAMAAENMRNSNITPTLFAYDPVKDANEQVARAQSAQASQASGNSSTNALTPMGWDGKTFYSLVDLRQRQVPQSIDWKNREQYLSPVDFQDTFGMSKDDFAKQPKWKRDKMKQALYLF